MPALELRAESFGQDADAPLLAANLPRPPLQLVDDPQLPAPPWQDKLQVVPFMRSALIALDEEDEPRWSKPFSLLKADFEPWLSYYAGYCSSRLFLQTARVEGDERPILDHAIRALLELRRMDARPLLEPLVRIDGPVEYFDPRRAPRARRQRGNEEMIARAAEILHQGQLKRAREYGEELGNHLYDALLGEGLANLIAAWESVHGRKPNAHELHLMLTTGRTKPVPMPDLPEPVPAASATPVPPRAPFVPPPRAAETGQAPAAPERAEVPAFSSSVFSKPEDHDRPLLRYLLHFVGAASLGALIYILVA